MILKSIRLVNFQCFKDSGEIPIHNMTVFIGENDSGKTSILKSLDYFFSDTLILPEIFHKIKDNQEQICEIIITLNVDIDTAKIIPKEYVIGNEICLKKIYTLTALNNVESEILLNKHIFEKNELNDVNKLKAPQLKSIFAEFGLDNYTTVDDAKDKIAEYINDNFDLLGKRQDWYSIKWNQISEYLPIFEHYDSYDYGNPQNLISKTLSSFYRTFFYDYDEEGNSNLKNELQKKKEEIKAELDRKIEDELKEKIKNINDRVETIGGDYSIDFAEGFKLSNITVDYGSGPRSINNIGEGSKKRLFLAIMEWDKEIRTKESHKKVIRGYDEPDASLHYSAQKQMFYTLKSISEDKETKVQPIICTHSLSMIDRAPPRIINKIVHENGVSDVEYLMGDESGIQDFLDEVSEISGIKNSSIFFERCFLIVEGITEMNALPELYRKFCDRSFSEDGVVLIDIEGNGSWKNFLKLLGRNKRKATLMLLDTDTNLGESKNYLTNESLEEIGFSQPFLDNNVIFIGNTEFEDAFQNNVICRCLNEYWPKNGDKYWVEEDIERLRNSTKFSKSLMDMVSKYKRETGAEIDYLRKPEFGIKIATTIEKDEIHEIEKLEILFKKINEIIR